MTAPEDGLREALALLDDALTVQRFPCRHKGIGMPGCVICDPRVYPGALAALRSTPAAPHEHVCGSRPSEPAPTGRSTARTCPATRDVLAKEPTDD